MWRRRSPDDFSEEVRAHLELEADQLEAEGLPRPEAIKAARRRFGSVARASEQFFERGRWLWLDRLRQDLRLAARLFVRRPSFSLAAIVTLALGIGANTLVFSLVRGVLVRDLAYRDPDRILMVRFVPEDQSQQADATVANYVALREDKAGGVFEEVGGMMFADGSLTTGPEDLAAEPVRGMRFTASMARVLGVSPALGRWFTDEEDDATVGLTLVLSDGLWRRRFDADERVVGRTVRLDGQPATIVGVMPPGFGFLGNPDEFWIPMRRVPTAVRSPIRYIVTAARLGEGVTLAQAQSRMPAVAASLAATFPETNTGWQIRLQPILDAYVGWARGPLFLLQGVVVLVLLVACANVAGLLLAQGTSRRREIAVRAALGSGRGRIVRQLLTESLLLGAIGGAAGMALAWAGLRTVVALNPRWLPRLDGVSIDGGVLAFALLTSLASAIVFGVVPALQASRSDLIDALKDGGRQGGPAAARQRLRGALVVAQVAVALVLLIGAGLLVHAFVRLHLTRLGFDTDRLLTFQVRLPQSGFLDNLDYDAEGHRIIAVSPRVPQTFEAIRSRVAAVPGVGSASSSLVGPIVPLATMGFTARRRAGAPTEASEPAAWMPVSAGYLRTIGVPLRRGREFEPGDTLAATPVAIVNETMARQVWPDEDPIGRQITMDVPNDLPREIVGVAADARPSAFQQEIPPQVYVPTAQLPLVSQARFGSIYLNATIVVRATGEDVAALVPSLRSAVAEFPGQTIFNVRTVDEMMAGLLQQPRQYVVLLSMFASVAFVLALVGLYGLMAYSVAQRTFEIGIRMALGADRGRVLRLILGQGLVLVAIGATLGTAAAIGATRLLESFLWGVTPTDPRTFVAVVSALVLVAAVACYIPARRALLIDPMVALRAE
jgi:putative ABC transport system permease protein